MNRLIKKLKSNHNFPYDNIIKKTHFLFLYNIGIKFSQLLNK